MSKKKKRTRKDYKALIKILESGFPLSDLVHEEEWHGDPEQYYFANSDDPYYLQQNSKGNWVIRDIRND